VYRKEYLTSLISLAKLILCTPIFINHHMGNKLLISLLLVVLLSAESYSQAITGTVKDGEGNVLKDANVLLLKFTDSSLVKGSLTNASGIFTLLNVPTGRYIIAASGTGYRQGYSGAVSVLSGASEVHVPVLTRK
jgi:hypothetical protein